MAQTMALHTLAEKLVQIALHLFEQVRRAEPRQQPIR